MAGLPKETHAVPLIGGLDTKTSPILVQPGSFLELENVFRLRTGELVKRYGSVFASGSSAASGNTTLGRLGRGIVQFLRAQSITSPLAFYPSASGGSGSWFPVQSESLGSTVTPVPRQLLSSKSDSTDPDTATSGNFTLIAVESGADIYASVTDNQASQPIVALKLASNCERPRCAAVGNLLCVFYADTVANSLSATVFDVTSGITFNTFVVAAGTLPIANRFLDVRPRAGGSTIVIAYRVAAGGVSFVEFNPATGSLATGPVNIAGVDANQCLGWVDDSFATGSYYLASAGTTSGVVVRTLSTAFAVTATQVMDGTATANVRNVTGYLSSAGGNKKVFWEVSAANTYDYLVRVATWTGASSVAVFMRSVGLATKPFTYRGNYYLVLSYDSTTQATHFVVCTSPGFIGASGFGLGIETPIAYGSAGGHTNKPSALACTYMSGTTAVTAMTSRTQLQASNGTFRTLRNALPIELRFDEAVVGPTRELGGAMFAPGGTLRSYDGTLFAGARASIAPEAIVPTNAGAGNLTALATYQWSAVYKTTDLTGRVSRSAPSVLASLTGGGTNFAASVAIPTLRVGYRAGTSYCVVELYRTLANQTVPYKVGEVANDVTVDTVTIADNLSDVTLAQNEILYDTGGILDDFDAPAFTAIEVFGNRLWGISSEDRTRVFYSKELFPGLGVAFRPDTFVRLDQADGDVFALGVLDANLIFFKRSAIYSLTGGGPDARGLGGYDDPAYITNSQGCTNPRSVIATPDGLMFEAQRGIWLLTRGGSLTYVGAGVDTYFTGGGQDISAAVHMPWRAQVRFFTTGGRTLVYDYQQKQWYTFTGQPAGSAITVGTSVYWSDPSTTDRVSTEVEGTYGDHGVGYAQRITTPNLAFSGIAGFQRCYAAELEGQADGAHTLQIDVALNYAAAATFTRSLASGSAWAGAGPEIRFDIQRCEAARLTVRESAANTGAGFRLSAMTLTVGVLPGLSRRPPSGRLT